MWLGIAIWLGVFAGTDALAACDSGLDEIAAEPGGEGSYQESKAFAQTFSDLATYLHNPQDWLFHEVERVRYPLYRLSLENKSAYRRAETMALLLRESPELSDIERGLILRYLGLVLKYKADSAFSSAFDHFESEFQQRNVSGMRKAYAVMLPNPSE